MRPNLLKHLLCVGAVACAIYLPTVLSPFERNDDYLMSIDAPAKPDHCNALYFYNGCASGRPLLIMANECVIHPIAWRFPGRWLFIVLRGLNLLCLILTYGLLSMWLVRCLNWGMPRAFAAAVLLIALPGQQFLIAQGLAIDNVFALPLAMLAAVWLAGGRAAGGWFGMSPARVAGAVAMLVVVFMTYQVHAMVFLLPALFAAVLGGARLTWRMRQGIAIRHLAVYGLAGACYVAVLKVMQAVVRLRWGFPGKTDDAGFHANWGDVLHNTLAGLYIPKAMNVWFVTASWLPGIIILAVIGMTGMAFLVRLAWRIAHGRAPLDVGSAVTRAALIMALYVGLQSPQIFHGDITYYRVLVYDSAFIVVLLLWAVQFWHVMIGGRYDRWLKPAALLAVAFIAVQGGGDAYRYFARICMREMSFLEEGLRPVLEGRAKGAVIIRPIGGVRLIGDEHGQMTSYQMNGYGLEGMVKRVYQRHALDSGFLQFQDVSCREISPICRAAVMVDRNPQSRGTGTVLIDMNVPYKELVGLK